MSRFLVLFLGDSVVWGQGLREEDKFSTWVIQWLNEYHPDLRAYKIVKAHSGAIIGAPGETAADPQWPGEVPSAFPTIHQQLAGYEGDEPDLVVIDGGINDVGIRQIFNPRTTADELRSHIRYVFGTLLPALLDAVAMRFTNPRTRVLVLGYYPIVSKLSRPAGIVPMMTAFGASTAGNPWHAVVDNALLFEAMSDELIQKAAGGRFLWVKPEIKAENAAFAPQPWIFGVKLPHIAAEDELAAERRTQCILLPDRDQRVMGYRASAGHPNRWGARAYFNAIYPVLQREYGL